MDQFIYLIIKKSKKNNLLSLLDNYYHQLPWKIGIFSTHNKSEKKLPYENFFCTPTSMVTTLFASYYNDKYGQFYVINYKFTNKNNLFSHVDTQYRQIPWGERIFSTHKKSEKKLPYGSFFYLPRSMVTTLFA